MSAEFLVLGAGSFYGTYFCDLLESRGHGVIKARHYDFGHADCIVNFASKSLVAESWDLPGAWMTANASELATLIHFQSRRTSRFVHVSTPEVYGSTPGWVDESYSDWKPSTPYAVSRAAGDMLLKAYHKACGLKAIITRTANIYGEGQQHYRIIPTAQRCKRTNTTLRLHGGGQSRRSFIHVSDACEALYLLCTTQGLEGETYHISTQRAHTIKEVVDLIGCKYEEVPDRLGKDEAYLLDSSKIRSMGWRDTIKLEDWICASSH